ncbi:hypothetical protein ABT104_10200 [Streptomyces mobaraensis]|uniref:hypothetical protein n=1 Tax=Streptomyces mobaraensis TaxID=35621 RepID=UPI00332DF401
MKPNARSRGLSEWRVELTPFRRPHLDADGNVCIPLWLCRDGVHVTDTALRLRPSEASPFRDHLNEVLGDAHWVSGRDQT